MKSATITNVVRRGVTRWHLTIPRWHPTKLNRLLNCHWALAGKLKRADFLVLWAAAKGLGIPRAETRMPISISKRRVELTIILGPRQRAGDPDAYWKSLLDGMKRAGLIVDDNRQSVELMPVQFERGPEMATRIMLEDIE